MDKPVVGTTEATLSRDERINRRLTLMKKLVEPVPFTLMKLVMERDGEITVDLDFTAAHFPGRYVYQIVEALRDLELLGLITITADHFRAGTFTRGPVFRQHGGDLVTLKFLKLLYQ